MRVRKVTSSTTANTCIVNHSVKMRREYNLESLVWKIEAKRHRCTSILRVLIACSCYIVLLHSSREAEKFDSREMT